MMIHQFYAHMPIRKKFDWIISLVLGLMAIPIAAGLTGGLGAAPGAGQTGLSLAAMGCIALLLLKAKQLICDPYVSTVVRMEALAHV